jgi:lipoyl(octanoyl) transferase
MPAWRLLDTGPLSGALNMAVDQALLKLHVRGMSPPTLRFYQWRPPAISIGHFQPLQTINLPLCSSLGIDVVRRPTGGRAVLHQNELTYSLVAGTREGIPFSLPKAYGLICQGLLAGFRLIGIEAEMGQERPTGAPPEICFLRSSISDIVCQGKKFVGSAQMWSGSSLLQHGSILLEPQKKTWANLMERNHDSQEKIYTELGNRITSLQELLGYRIETDRIMAAIVKGMALILGVTFETSQLSPEEWTLAQDIARADQGEEKDVMGLPVKNLLVRHNFSFDCIT